VTRLSAATLQTLVAELALDKQVELGDQPRLLEISHQGKRYVIAGGPWRQQRDQDRRQSRIAKAEAELKRLAAVPRKEVLIAQETQQDGWYLLHTNEPIESCAAEQVLAHYKGLLDVEEAFCELKSYLEVRPVYHRRPDRVVNHVRLCFLAYWLSARLGGEWRAKGETEEVPRLLRHLQTIRLGSLRMGKRVEHALMTQIPK